MLTLANLYIRSGKAIVVIFSSHNMIFSSHNMIFIKHGQVNQVNRPVFIVHKLLQYFMFYVNFRS